MRNLVYEVLIWVYLCLAQRGILYVQYLTLHTNGEAQPTAMAVVFKILFPDTIV